MSTELFQIDNDKYWLPYGIHHDSKCYTSAFLRTKDGGLNVTLRMIDKSPDAENFRAYIRQLMLHTTYVLYYDERDKTKWEAFWEDYHSDDAIRMDFINDLNCFRRHLTTYY